MPRQVIKPNHSALEQSGLKAAAWAGDSLNLREIPEAAIIHLQGFPGKEPTQYEQLGLPMAAGQCDGGSPAVLCLGPAEWLIVAEAIGAADLQRQVTRQLAADQAVVNDRSDGLCLFRLSGAAAPWLLNKLSCLDFQLAGQSSAHCARTRL